jgi:hypothetical protein
MIEVTIKHIESDKELGRITIENLSSRDSEEADYAIRFAVERITGIGLHNRGIHSFPRTKYNVLALLRQVLATLDESELKLPDGTIPADLAGRFGGIGKQVQRWKSRFNSD